MKLRIGVVQRANSVVLAVYRSVCSTSLSVCCASNSCNNYHNNNNNNTLSVFVSGRVCGCLCVCARYSVCAKVRFANVRGECVCVYVCVSCVVCIRARVHTRARACVSVCVRASIVCFGDWLSVRVYGSVLAKARTCKLCSLNCNYHRTCHIVY